ncbi:MAG: nuclear transport factor 2 family protein [Sphingomonadales bacterium]
MTSPDADTGPENPIVRMFTWWNRAFGEVDGFTPQAFADHYTSDGELVVNGNLRGRGPEALARHYRNLQDSFDTIRMVLPVIDDFSCTDRAFVQCVTEAVRDGKTIREEAMAAATIRDGRIAHLKVIGRSTD